MDQYGDRIIDALTAPEFSSLQPEAQFKTYAEQYGGDLSDDKRFYEPLYPDFTDYNRLHDTAKVDPVYLNDFDFCLEEDRERIASLIRMDFNTDTFETVARCSCGHLKGNYLLGQKRSCPICQSLVEKVVETSLDTKVWVRVPEGVVGFISPAYYKTFLSKIATNSPKIEIVTWLIDPSYRRGSRAQHTESGRRMLAELDKLGIVPGLNSFILNADRFMEHFLVGEGRGAVSMKPADGKKHLDKYYEYRHLIFPRYLSVPNKLATIIEQDGKDKYVSSTQLKTSAIYQSIADTRDSTEFYKCTIKDLKENADIVGKAIVRLGKQNSDNYKSQLFAKSSLIRKHVIAGSLSLSGRGVITSTTGLHDAGVAKIPWIMAVAMLKKHILGYLYRLGYSPLKAESVISTAAHQVVPVIDQFFTKHEKQKDIVCILGRNPSIQYLSAKAFFMSINRDLEDESINLPILSVKTFNADFDGDTMYCYVLSDLKGKAKAYGSFGHQSMLDENEPFTISRFADQTSTNLMNLNNMMRGIPINECG
ncbi:hypothetical protein [Klebsiella quasipneumoniae]|uniref:hypothetical protein n=1 Tax=Klebsiella quasipneumoniae TaxID=1463165 RepID=UPI0023AFEE2D|nr:hypothetical protein [Klebsiella quasipneumoniae]